MPRELQTDDDRNYAHLLTLLSVSAAMVGVCLTAVAHHHLRQVSGGIRAPDHPGLEGPGLQNFHPFQHVASMAKPGRKVSKAKHGPLPACSRPRNQRRHKVKTYACSQSMLDVSTEQN